MANIQYMSGAEKLEALTTAYRSFPVPANAPVIPDAVPFRRFCLDVTSELEGQNPGLNGGVEKAQEAELTWQDVQKRMAEHRGTTEAGNPIVRQTKVKLVDYSRKAVQDYNSRDTLNISRLKGEEIATYRAAVPYESHYQAWDRFIQGQTALYGTSYDGQNFFDTAHVGPGATTYSNYTSGLLDLDETNLDTVLTTLKGYRKENGDTWANRIMSTVDMMPETNRDERNNGAPSFHIFCGSALESKARELARVSTSNPSKFAGQFTVSVVFPIDESAEPNSWYVWLPREGMLPLFFGDWGTWDISELDADKKEFLFYVHARFGFGYGWWHVMYKVRNQA